MNTTAILLCAGVGSRIREVTSEPKCLLPVAGRPIIQHQLEAVKLAGISNVVIVVGYEEQAIRAAVARLETGLQIRFVSKPDFRIMGNSHSLLVGLQAAAGPVVVFDGDLVFEPQLLLAFLANARSAFLIGPGRLDDWECAKALADDQGFIRKLVDKRLLSNAELERYQFVGEAMGIIYLADTLRTLLIEAATNFLRPIVNQGKNWEHLFSDFLKDQPVGWRMAESERWIEIDTVDDYAAAQALFGAAEPPVPPPRSAG